MASETILLSSVIANRWKVWSRGVPAWGMIFDPRSAIRLVTRAKASRPLSVNSIVTTGAFVCGSLCAFGFLMSVPFSSVSSSSTKKRLIWAGWLCTRSASTIVIPRGTSMIREPAGGPPEPSAFSSSRHAVPLANSGALPGAGVKSESASLHDVPGS